MLHQRYRLSVSRSVDVRHTVSPFFVLEFLTFDDGIVAAPVKEDAHGFVTALVHLVSLDVATQREHQYILTLIFWLSREKRKGLL